VTAREPAAPVLGRIRVWVTGRDTIRAALLTGSRARHGAELDAFSDYDVALYVADPHAYLAEPGWYEELGEVLVSFRDRDAIATSGRYTQLVLYEAGVKVDYTIAPARELERMSAEARLSNELDLGWTTLVDKDGLTESLPAPSGRAWIPERPTQAVFSALVEEFWWETGYVVKNLARGELLPAKYSLEVVMKLDLLRRMLEWRAGTERDWSWRPGVLGRGLRGSLDDGTWRELEATFAGASIEENRTALFRTIDLFRRTARRVAERESLEYPERLEDRMMAWLENASRMIVASGET